MKTSPTLLVRRFLQAIHPPLPPRSSREAKQLVGALESAFHKRLDESHPSPQALSVAESLSPDPAHQATRATHNHLSSLLAHPLLQRVPDIPTESKSITATALAKFQKSTLWSISDFQFVQDCCRLYLEGLRRKEKVPRDRRLGLQLISWYTQMTPSLQQNFLVDSHTLHSAVTVLYIDGLEAEVWDWLRTLYERSFGKAVAKLDAHISQPHFQAEDHLISFMIHETARKGALADAAQQFVEACKYNESRGRTERSQDIPLGRSWHRLSCAILASRGRFRFSHDLYDEIIRYATKVHRLSSWHPSSLQIYHPSNPTAKPLMEWLSSHKLEVTSLWGKLGKSESGKPPRMLFPLIQDAVTLSHEQGHYGDARFLHEFIDSFSPGSASSQPTDKVKQISNHSNQGFNFGLT